MILDKGVCSVFRRTDTGSPGGMPSWTYSLLHQSWYGELDFATTPANPTNEREELQTDARIRVMQCRDIRQHDVVVLAQLSDFAQRDPAAPVFDIERAYHGMDDDGPTPISDLSLREVVP